jgi:2-keto-4-pentenoate hydratase/2-oxohepta-3-ene-1,7-dioic acid hydratase in catechol pathway
MRFIRYDDGRTGVLGERGGKSVVVDLRDTLGASVDRDWREMIVRWDEFQPRLSELVADPAADLVRDLDSVSLRAPVPAPSSRVFALGVNFRSHVSNAASAVGQQDPTATTDRPPVGFFVIPGTYADPEEQVGWPAEVQKLDYEAEVAVVLSSGGQRLEPEEIRFWGHTGFNDLSIRDPHFKLSRLDEGSLAWSLQKNFQGANAIGPSLVVGEGHDPARLGIRSSVNGELRQDGSTTDMINSFQEVAAYLSQYLRLEVGDMLTSGTPAGTAIEQGIDGPFLKEGDVIEVEIEGAGVLRNRIGARVAAPASTR